MTDGRLPLHIKAGYGAGQIAGQLFRDAPSLLLLFYLTSVIGIAPAVAGAAIFLPKVLFGAVADLGVGIVSDRVIARFPRRRWLLIGAVLAPSAMVGIFAVPEQGQAAQIGYVVALFSLYMIAFSTFSVPYLAEFAEISDDPDERTVLMAWRHGFTGVGILVGSALIPYLIHRLGGGRPAYDAAAIVLAVICCASLLVAWWAASRIPLKPRRNGGVSMAAFVGAVRDRRFLVLGASSVVQTIGQGMSYASFAFFVSYAMARPDAFLQMGILSMISAVTVMAGSPIWVYVARGLGKRNTYVLGAVAHAIVAWLWTFTPGAPLWVMYLYAVAVGLFNSGWGLIVLSLLSDAIVANREETGIDRGGSMSALWSIIEKAGIALGGTLIVGAILALGGFDGAVAKAGGVQSSAALAGIAWAFGYAPALLRLVAAAIIWALVADDRPAVPAGRRAHAA